MKGFEEATAENAFWEAQTEKFASDAYYSDLFDAAFNEHTAKLAALDPEYGMILQVEQEKMAFDQAYYETLAAYGQA